MGSTRKTGPLNAEQTSAPFDLALALELSRTSNGESNCPGSDSIAAYYEGRLPETEASAQEKHLAGCIRCQGQVVTLARADESADSPPRESPRSESRLGVWMVFGLGVAAATGIALLIANRTQQPSVREAPVREVRQSQAVVPETTASNSIQAAQPQPATAGLTMAPSAGQSTPISAGSQMLAPHLGRSATSAPKLAAAQPPQLPMKLAPDSKTRVQQQTIESTQNGANVVMKGGTPAQAESPTEEDEPPNQTTLPPPRFELSSPRESAYWRIGIDGSIAWSHDGDHWELQRRGDGASIESGMATDAFVCWLVGANGTILRSADGTTWSRVASPTTDNLIGVSVRNAYVATITTSSGKRFQTTDGGRDWNLI